MFLLVLFVSVFNVIYGLQCTNNCSMIYSMNQPFTIPSDCHYISSYRCSVKLVFWYDRGHYVITFPGDILYDQNIGDNRHFIMIETAINRFFSYDINHVCRDKDDCARYFAEEKIPEMTQRFFNISNIYSDLHRILYRKSTSSSQDLACFDTTDVIRQCAVSGMIGSCQIIDDLVKYKLHRRSCQRSTHESASVNIYDSGSFAMMTVKCNRMLCNGPLTVEAVKKILHRYNITDIHGRLPGTSSHISIKFDLLILTLFLSFQLK